MVSFLKILAFPYPFILLIIIAIQAIKISNKNKGKDNTLPINLVFGLSLIIYLISFFANYGIQFFIVLWLIRDFIIFFVLIKIWELILEKKTSYAVIYLLVFIAFGFILNRISSSDGVEEVSFTSVNYEFDNSAEILFDLKAVDELDEIKDLLKPYNAEVQLAFPQIKDKSSTELDDYYTVDIDDNKKVNEIIDVLNKSGLVDWVEDNDVYTLSPIETTNAENIQDIEIKSLNDPFVSKLWGFEKMGVDQYFSKLKDKKVKRKAKIFILDTGIDSKHEDLSENYLSLSDKYDKDSGTHGTHCAGIACAVSNNKIGIASLNLTGEYTSITSITVLPGGSGTQEAVIDGIILAADNGADVISMSLGGYSTQKRQKAYNDAIEYANSKGAIIVVAAGNENSNAKNHVPASCKNVIAVSAVDENLKRASFSNYVTDIEYKVAAPGVDIYSTVPGNQYRYMNGTSMATPYVSGLVGILKSFDKDLTVKEAYEILSSTGADTKNTKKTGKFIQPLAAIEGSKAPKGNSGISKFIGKLISFNPI